VNLAAGISERGYDTLLIDLDAQGNVGASLGVRGERSMYHLLVQDPATTIEDVTVPVRKHLDVITSDATLAAAEVWLARQDTARDKLLTERLAPLRGRYQYVVLDCGPSLSLLNQNALSFVDEVMIPVSCDYLALVGVKQVMRTLKDVDKHLGHTVKIAGVVPTFFDARTKLAREAVDTLGGHFKERLYEYAPESVGAEDYRRLVERFVANATRPTAETPTTTRAA
jgi:chromosome partitioning protein